MRFKPAKHSPQRLLPLLILAASTAAWAAAGQSPSSSGRLRYMIETDAGGDPDDEQSLVRFLLYANEWEVEGIIANRPQARAGENLNPERRGLGIVRALVTAYGQCYTNLVRHDPRYPPPAQLLRRTVAGYANTEEGVDLLIAAVDRDDPRPLWFSNWGTDHGSAPSCLKRALDRVLRERGQDGYARFKNRLRLSSYDVLGEHTGALAPPFKLWVDTFRPELDGRRWYHRFSALTARAGGFDLERDVRTGHGPLGALYPTNTTHWQKEGDSMCFLYLVPTGLSVPEEPTWGSWAGRYGLRPDCPGQPYYWANQADEWRGTIHRENSLRRWAEPLQNDFRARLDWCVKPVRAANHPPVAVLNGVPGDSILRLRARAGSELQLDGGASRDPDGDRLRFEWFTYPEAGSYRGGVSLEGTNAAAVKAQIPAEAAGSSIHVILAVTDQGEPPLTRYRRAVVSIAASETITVRPKEIDDVLVNPGIGFTTFQRFNGDSLNEGLKWTEGFPIRYQEFRGALTNQDHPMTSIAYFRVYWRFVEPEPGAYRWDMLDQALATARARGQTLMLRIAPYGTGADTDVPAWYRALVAGQDLEKKMPVEKWQVHPENPLYVQHFGGLIRALGTRYDGHADLELVDVSIVGAWGEGAGAEQLSEPTRRALLECYLDSFSRTPLVLQLQDERAAQYALARRPVGWRVDCLGDMGGFSKTWSHMNDYYPQTLIQTGLQEAWRRAPVTMEVCWVMQHWKNQGWDIDHIIDESLKWHISSFNAKSSPVPAEWWPQVNRWLKKMGYRFVLRKFTFPARVGAGEELAFTSWWDNKGVAPCYRRFPLALRLKSGPRTEILRTAADITAWLPGDSLFDSAVNVPATLPGGDYELALALLDPQSNLPKVRLAIENRGEDGWYKLGNIRVASPPR